MVEKIKNKPQPPATVQNFPIVGIGASAGGLDAFKRLLKAIPKNSGMAYVLVQHLDPSHESILPDILQRITKIPVHEIIEDIHLAPNHIYIIPSNKILTSTDGVLQLTPRAKKIVNFSIDIFFKSLADVHKESAIGVVLSGTGTDGTQGLQAIKEHGGITFAQDQDSASYGSMPQNAIDADFVDFILPPEEIPAKLLQMMHTYNGLKNTMKKSSKDEEDIFNQIILVLRQSSGVDFTYYKQTTVRRRITRRMVISGNENLTAYLKFLKKNTQEQDALFNDMLIPVTSFFRNPIVFQTITQNVFPALLKNKTVTNPIRMWVAGCSTGEEVYSLAISLHQYLEKISSRQIQIFASDISENAIAKARIGSYRSADLKDVPNSILKNYFTRNGEGYQVNKQIRDMCVFAIHDFLQNPPFAKMDFISCRNVLIYMEPFLQKKALSTFHYALKENGFLLLGKAETTGPAAELFIPFSKEDKIYSRKAVPNRFMHYNTVRFEGISTKRIKKEAKQEEQKTDFRKTAQSLLLSKYTPPSVIVNEQMDVVHINGIINPFLEVPQGKSTFNLLKMAREGLSFELRNTIHKAKTTNTVAIKEGVLVKYDGKIMQITVEVVPLISNVEPHFLVLFHKIVLPEKKKVLKGKLSPERIMNDETHQRIEQLENEITLTREDMRAITEDQEAANEELQSANEELLSSSEELQSLNEELETSKEELQSTNEELIIINQEMLDKQGQINSARQYAEAIITTVREPLVVLDQYLRIKSCNSSFFTKFDISPHETEGELIYEIQDNLLDNAQLRSLLEKILPKKTEMNDYKIFLNLPDSGKRTLLLNARHVINEKNKEQLILLAIEDITEEAAAQKLVEENVVIADAAKRIAEEAKIKAENATEAARNAVIAKQQFLSNMSHEIRTPMNAIIGFAAVLMKTDLTEKQKEYLQAIKSGGDTLIVLINDILDLSKVDAGKMIFSNSPFKILDSITTIVHLFEQKIKENNLELVKEYDSRIPEILLGDSIRLHQILINLFSNAIKFTPKGKITVSVNLISQDEEKVTLEIKIADTGIGIPKNKIATIFENFEQAHNFPSNFYGGTGLGLAIVKQLVEKQGGSISVESKVNEGSTFGFRLSFQKTNVEVALENGTGQYETEIKLLKVLVVEDVKLNQLLMKTILDDFEFTSDIADNGKIAIEKLQTNSYDIILMDLQMPIMNGFETTEHIRKEMNSQIPIIALTADVTTVDIAKCKALGMNDYISKPLDEKLLHSKILSLIRST